MKKIALTLVTLIAFAGVAIAAPQESYEYKGGNMGKITFPHKKHMALGCAKCHEGAPKKIEINKGVAHDQLCLKCHKAEGKGPKNCKDCHKK